MSRIDIHGRLVGKNGRMTSGLFSSDEQVYSTPRALFDSVDREFGFDLDVCATAANAKCKRFFTIADDGLRQKWDGVCWMNPPYDDVMSWMAKAWMEAGNGCTVVSLLPARTDTAWFHIYAAKGEIRFIRGRLRFEGQKSSSPFPSILVIFRPRSADAEGS